MRKLYSREAWLRFCSTLSDHPTVPHKWYPIAFDYTIDKESYIENTKWEFFLAIDAGRIFVRNLSITEITDTDVSVD